MTALLASGCSSTKQFDKNTILYKAEGGKYVVSHYYNAAFNESTCNLVINDQRFSVWLRDIDGDHAERYIYIDAREAQEVDVIPTAYHLPRQLIAEDDSSIQIIRDAAKLRVTADQDGKRQRVEIDLADSREAIHQFERCKVTHEFSFNNHRY